MDDAQFDSPRKALAFALNYESRMPRPLTARKIISERLHTIELADGSKIVVAGARRTAKKRTEGLTGLDGAATAGFILHILATLPEEQQLVLMAECRHPAFPCACRSPCCKGYRPNLAWVGSVRRICEHLRDEAQLSSIVGKKGMSTAPGLRLALVEKFFSAGKEFVYARIAEQQDVSEQTVMNHRRPIFAYLEERQRAGWRALDEALGSAGIVGNKN